jgi:flavin-dependent dehydrogenase
MTTTVDVFIAGGGPAGLAAAIAARKKGLQVIVADGASYPIEKACGEGLMPGTVRALRELGVEIRNADGAEFRGIRFVDGTRRVHADFPQGSGIGIRRKRLHEKMVQAAEKSGALLLWNTPVTAITSTGAFAGHRFYPARWIIGADGAQSRIAKWSGLAPSSRPGYRFARQQHFEVSPWSQHVEIYWAAQSQAYVTPVGSNEICIAMLTRDPNARMETLLAAHPELAARLSGQKLSSVERGAITGTHRLRRVAKGNVLLIGDASGTVDAITGEGMRLGFEHAFAAADAIVSGNLHEYERKHRQIARRPGAMAALLQMLNAKPRLRERVFRVLGEAPELFEKLLALHVGESSALHAITAGAGLGWKLLFA